MAGADAVYCGIEKFNARNRAANISLSDLPGIVQLAHENRCKVYLTLNILIFESELPDLFRLLNRVNNFPVDGLIVQDLGLLYLLMNYFPNIPVHASTQLTTHNSGQIQFLKSFSVNRVNLSRELSLDEIKELSQTAIKEKIETEVFVHGSFCISFSGLCYMSVVLNGNSGNRGRCSQPCRDPYKTQPVGGNYPLHLKDNSAFLLIQELADLGVNSFKIEGRIKKYDYVYTVVRAWRKQLDRLMSGAPLSTDQTDLYQVFNRDFSDAYLRGQIDDSLFAGQPRDNSIASGQEGLYTYKQALTQELQSQLKGMKVAKEPIALKVSGRPGHALEIQVKTNRHDFVVRSSANLATEGKEVLSYKLLKRKFAPLEDTAYHISSFELDEKMDSVFLPLSELTRLRHNIFRRINEGQAYRAPVNIEIQDPDSGKSKEQLSKPLFSLVDREEHIDPVAVQGHEQYYLLPDGLSDRYEQMVKVFSAHPKLIPWFPAILIGEDYNASLRFLEEIRPSLLITNNTGIAHAANAQGIDWIAGPEMNISNSFSLLALSENYGCVGAYLSEELNQDQIKRIKKPDPFKLYYRIYRSQKLMTTRQCLFHENAECTQKFFDASCLNSCEKMTTLKNSNGTSFVVRKRIGRYPAVYHSSKYFDHKIIANLPDTFSGYTLDVSE